MKFKTSLLAFLLIISQANVHAADKSEIVKFCKKTKSYENCLVEFQGLDKIEGISKTEKPIEIEVIPWKS